jgi:outer membrane protein assembly factor BamB
LEARDVTLTRDDRVTLWQIQPDGKYRAAEVEAAKGKARFSEPLTELSPTGAIIPDGREGVLISMRRTRTAGSNSRPDTEEFVYRLNQDGKLMYRFFLPPYHGKLHDGKVLGEDNFGFATRGGTLIAFDVQEGTEKWRWNSSEDVEVFVALKNGACVIQTPTALVQVDGPSSFEGVGEGQVHVGLARGHVPEAQLSLPFQTRKRYSSFTTTTVTSAVTSLCSRTGTLYSPNCLIGSSSWIFRRSIV